MLVSGITHGFLWRPRGARVWNPKAPPAVSTLTEHRREKTSAQAGGRGTTGPINLFDIRVYRFRHGRFRVRRDSNPHAVRQLFPFGFSVCWFNFTRSKIDAYRMAFCLEPGLEPGHQSPNDCALPSELFLKGVVCCSILTGKVVGGNRWTGKVQPW